MGVLHDGHSQKWSSLKTRQYPHHLGKGEEEGQMAAAHPAARLPLAIRVPATEQHGIVPGVVVVVPAGVHGLVAGCGPGRPWLDGEDEEVAALHRGRHATGGARGITPLQALPCADGVGEARDVVHEDQLARPALGELHPVRIRVAVEGRRHGEVGACNPLCLRPPGRLHVGALVGLGHLPHAMPAKADGLEVPVSCRTRKETCTPTDKKAV